MKPGTEVWRVVEEDGLWVFQRGTFCKKQNGWVSISCPPYPEGIFGHVVKYHGYCPFMPTKEEALFKFTRGHVIVEYEAAREAFCRLATDIKHSIYNKAYESGYSDGEDAALEAYTRIAPARKPFWKRWLGW